MEADSLLKQATEFIAKIVPILPDNHKDNRDYFEKFLNNFETAKGMADDTEKMLQLKDAAVKIANQAAFIAFREGILTDELEKEYRGLPSAEYTTSMYKAELDKRKSEDEELMNKVREAQNRQKSMDIFTQVLGGLSKEEAEERYAKYQQAGGM